MSSHTLEAMTVASHSRWRTLWSAGWSTKACTARFRTGAPEEHPSRVQDTSPSSRRSLGRVWSVDGNPAAPDRVRDVEAADPVRQAPAEERCGAGFEIAVAGEFRVERLKTSGGAEQHPRGVVGPPHGEGDPRAEQFGMCPSKRVERAGEGGGDERERLLERPGGGLARAAARARLAWVSGSGVSRTACWRKAAVAAAPPRACAWPAQCSSSAARVLVGPGRAVGAVPRPTVGFGVRVGGGGERAVNRLALAVGRGAVDRRADERVAEANALAELAQVRGGCGLVPGPVDSRVFAQRARQLPDRRSGSAAATSNRRCCRRRGSPLGAGSSPRSRWPDAQARADPKPPASSACVSPRGSSRMANGFPARLRDDPVTDPLVHRHMDRRPQQRARIVLRPGLPLRAAGSPASSLSTAGVRVAKTIATDSAEQAAGHEGQRLGRRAIEPLRVVDHTDQRLLPGADRRALRARPGQRGSDRAPVRYAGPNAVPMASRWGSGSLARWSSIGAQS